MIKTNLKLQNIILTASTLLFFIVGGFSLSFAKDTDIYQVNTKQNCYILLDNSASMDFGVYEQNIDYKAMFNYLFTLNDDSAAVSDQPDYIYDTVMNSNYFYDDNKKYSRRQIYLLKGNIGLTVTTVDSQTVAFTGDAADPNYIWYVGDIRDTHTIIDSDGNLSLDSDTNGAQRLTTDASGNIFLDGVVLPLNQDINLHQMQTLYDGSQVDIGLGGLLNAPGYYFSGYENGTLDGLDTAEDGDTNVVFLVTGNWINMQMMYNLHYKDNPGSFAAIGDPAWKYEYFSEGASAWPELVHSLSFPAAGNYTKNLNESDTLRTITHPGAAAIQVHFSAFDVEGDGNVGNFNDDSVVIRDGAGTWVAEYDEDNDPTAGDGWSATINGETVQIALDSDNNNDTGSGYTIDKIRVTYSASGYLMQNRLDVAKDSILYVLDAFHGKMNWGYASYQYTGGGSGDGATINSALNPNLTDDANRAAITNHVSNESIKNGGTPLGEALQDVFEKGYWTKRHALNNLLCRKNYIISVTDGFPSEDEDWNRISDSNGDAHLPFSDWDGDGWTSDPYQPPTSPNYYDDVGHWMYTHSWDDKTEVADPANSYVNVMTHHISFGSNHPLLLDAAAESGGEYVVAYNKEQLVAAFYALALQMTEAVSFTSPVVSVDSANKIQNGDDLYLGLFLPQDNRSWMGNIKKFRLGDGSAERPEIWMIYDGNDNDAINSSGNFLDNTAAYWADDNDDNDSDDYGSSDVREDGVGEVLKERVSADLISTDYWERPIYTYGPGNTPNMKKVHKDSITKDELTVADDLTRDKIINYLYGYTYDPDEVSNTPVAVRDWVLGSIVHSRPVVIDYYDPTNFKNLTNRYIVVGANDGMLHFFDDTDPDGDGPQKPTGKEIFAFVPQDLLPKLQLLPVQPFVDMVDGEITLYRSNKQPKYLIFGERIGGSAYWCLDISDTDPLQWSVKWVFSNPEIAQSWSAPIVSTIPVSVDAATGKQTFKDILIFTGGYDPEENNYPEPFNDVDNSGSPFKDTGGIDTGEWKSNEATQDINANNSYDYYNPDQNEYGRGIFAIDIEDASSIIFSATYGATTDVSGNIQTLSSMKFCFPASPSIVSGNYSYFYKEGGVTVEERKPNILKAIYAIDIYSNLYKIDYSFEINDDVDTDPSTFGPFSIANKKWETTHIFSGNPGSLSTNGLFGAGDEIDADKNGRKTFYPPVVSWGGACSYLDSSNYRFTNTTFPGQNEIASLYFGTGDREHPTYTMIQNRFYAVYDDSSVTSIDDKGTIDPSDDALPAVVSTVPYKEDDLLNLTCNDLDTGSLLTDTQRFDLKDDLRDDPIYEPITGTQALENGIHENDAKGWYIVFENQGSGLCDGGYTEDHKGEKMLSKPDLYAGILYFTTYQPAVVDPCNPQGNGFAYALNYCDGTAGYNLNTLNDPVGGHLYDISDRSNKVSNIFGIPSDFAIVTRKGQAGAMSMMGGKIIGPQGGNIFQIKSPGMGLELYYWRESNSQK